MTTLPGPSRLSAESLVPSRYLAVWTSLQIATAASVLVVVASTTVLRPAIALGVPGLLPNIAIPAGMAFWLLFGLLGRIRARARPAARS